MAPYSYSFSASSSSGVEQRDVTFWERWLGRLVVFTMVCFICFQMHVLLFLALPWYRRSLLVTSCLQLCGVAVMVNVLVDYARTSLTDPGRPSAAAAVDARAREAAFNSDWKSGTQAGWCEKCAAPKPPRAHHCSSCRRCTLKMDHHCIFTNSCIGQDNYRYFLFFLWDLVIGLSLIVLVELPQAFEIVVINISQLIPFEYKAYLNRSLKMSILRFEAPMSPSGQLQLYFLLGVVTAMVALIFLVYLSSNHLNQVLINVTTIEELLRQSGGATSFESLNRRPKHDRGSLANVSEVFGPPPAWCRRRVATWLNCLRYWFADVMDDPRPLRADGRPEAG